MPDPRQPDEILEENLRRLLQKSYRPVAPSDLFRQRLLRSLRDRQSRGLGPRVSLGSLAAVAAVILVALTIFHLDEEPIRVEPMTSEGFELALASGSRQRLHKPAEITGGEGVLTGARSGATLSWSDGTRVQLEAESALWLRARDRAPVLARGSCRIEAASHGTRTFHTSILAVRARDAEFRVRITESDRSMKKSIAGAVGVTTVVLVTVMIYNNQSEPGVVVDTEKQQYSLTTGDSATFGSDGSVSIRPAGATVTSSTPATATTAAGDAALEVRPMEVIRGRVQTPERDPVAQAQVIFHEDRGTEEVIVARVPTDDEGNFELTVEKGAKGRIEALRERYVTTSVPWAPLETADGSDGEDDPDLEESPPATDVGSDEDDATAASQEELVLTLVPETAIAGRVLFPDGEHPERYLVTVERYFDMYRRDEPVMKSFSEEDSTFYFPVKPGMYRVWAYAEGFFRTAEHKVAPTESQRVEVDFTMKPGLGVTGRVFSKRTGLPVSEAIVFAPLEHLPGTVNRMERSEVNEAVRNAQRTSADGAFDIQDFPPGQHLIRVLHPDYMPKDQTVVLQDGEPAPNLEFVLEEGSGIRGQVLDGRGEPIAKSMVLAIQLSMVPASANQNMDFCDESGNYHIRNLSPGPYILVLIENYESVDAETANPKVEMAQLLPGKDTVHDFVEIPTDAAVMGRVLDSSGHPLPGVQISLNGRTRKNPGGWTFKTASSDSEGNFEVLNLELGEYFVGLSKVYGQSFATVDKVVLDEAKDYERDFVFHDLVIEGVVRAEGTNELLPNAELVLLRRIEPAEDGDEDEFGGRAVSDDEGAFRIEGLPPGTYYAVCSAPGYRQTVSQRVILDDNLHSHEKIEMKLGPGATVVVTVVDSEGAPVPGAVVELHNARGDYINQGLPPQTDASGVYVFDRLIPGSYQARIYRQGEEPVAKPFEAQGATPTRVDVTLPTGQ